MADVSIVDIEKDLTAAVKKVFTETIRGSDLLKSSGEVYLKPNGIDFKPFAFTDPAVLEAVIDYFYDEGADRVFVMENSTQANMTRVVFEFTGYHDICKNTGARALYLDENPSESVTLPHFDDPIELPRIVVKKLIEERDAHTYISLPKLKTHSMTTVTLGIKNQMAFPHHAFRGYHHGKELHRFLADLYSVVRPDYTLIDGSYAVFNGHYPLARFLTESIEELGVLIGGQNTLSTDVIGAHILGYEADEVEHLRIVREDNNSGGNIHEIHVSGDLTRFTKRYPCDILDRLPDDVRIIQGKEMLCAEGCDLNTRMVLQMLYFDHGGHGGFTILMGKGFDQDSLDSIEGRVLLAGDCAIRDAKEALERKLGKKNVYTSTTCNRLAETMSALGKLMGVSALSLVPSKSRAIQVLLVAKLRGSKALIPDIL